MAKIRAMVYAVLLSILSIASGCNETNYSIETVNLTGQKLENSILTIFFEDQTTFVFEEGRLIPDLTGRGSAVQMWNRSRPIKVKLEFTDFEGKTNILEKELPPEDRAKVRYRSRVFLFVEKGKKIRIEVKNR